MAKRISQLDELLNVDGTEEIPIVKDGRNYRVKANRVGGNVTKASIGLGNVDNTSDADKPISTATQTALNGKANSSHAHAISEVTGLTEALADKANSAHQHQVGDINGLQTALDGKAAAEHSHDASSISGLGALLDTKSDVGHTHTKTEIQGLSTDLAALQNQINQKAGLAHGHNISEINGLAGVLESKSDVGHVHVSGDIDDFVPAVQGLIDASLSEIGASPVGVGVLDW